MSGPLDNPLAAARMMKAGAERGNGLLNVESAAINLVKSLGGNPSAFTELPPHLAAAYIVSLHIVRYQGPPQP